LKTVRALTVVFGAIAVLLVLPAGGYAAENPSINQAAPNVTAEPQATIHGCRAGWFCLYQNVNFNIGDPGRRPQFRTCNRTQNLTDFGFNDQASSWVNNTSHSVRVFRDVGGHGVLWTAAPHSRVSDVGRGDNDEASSLRVLC